MLGILSFPHTGMVESLFSEFDSSNCQFDSSLTTSVRRRLLFSVVWSFSPGVSSSRCGVLSFRLVHSEGLY